MVFLQQKKERKKRESRTRKWSCRSNEPFIYERSNRKQLDRFNGKQRFMTKSDESQLDLSINQTNNLVDLQTSKSSSVEKQNEKFVSFLVCSVDVLLSKTLEIIDRRRRFFHISFIGSSTSKSSSCLDNSSLSVSRDRWQMFPRNIRRIKSILSEGSPDRVTTQQTFASLRSSARLVVLLRHQAKRNERIVSKCAFRSSWSIQDSAGASVAHRRDQFSDNRQSTRLPIELGRFVEKDERFRSTVSIFSFLFLLIKQQKDLLQRI